MVIYDTHILLKKILYKRCDMRKKGIKKWILAMIFVLINARKNEKEKVVLFHRKIFIIVCGLFWYKGSFKN